MYENQLECLEDCAFQNLPDLVKSPSQSKMENNVQTSQPEGEHVPMLSKVETKTLPNQRITFFLLFAAFVITLGSFQFGYNIGVTNSPQEAISGGKGNSSACDVTDFFKPCVYMDSTLYSVFVSIFVLGALIGGIFAGPVADAIGRRTTLFFSNVFFVVGSIMLAIFSNFYVFVTARLLIGVGVGVVSVVAPLYLAEISPPNYRGSIGAMHQFMIVGAILVVNILGIPLSDRPHWRFLLGFPAVIATLQLVLLPFCPMSPRWLMSKGWTESARLSLQRLRGAEDVEAELESLTSKEEKKPFWKSLIAVFRVGLIRPIFVGLILHVGQQFSGINAIMFYSTNIFKSAGIDSATIATMAVGIVNIIFSAISVYLVEKLGRKWLLLGSQVVSGISFTVLAISYILKANKIAESAMSIIAVICVLLYIAGFAIGLGPVPWIMLSELYPDDVRGICQGGITAVNWLCTFIIALSFPSIAELLKEYTFVPFAAFIFLSVVLTFFFVPETKGKTMEELTGGI
jgi:SP family facilitated glucose transporter-like MFS transporter 3